MPSRDEMLKALREQRQQFPSKPTREEMLTALREKRSASEPSEAESLARGAAQGATLGFADEGVGLFESIKHGLKTAKFDPKANPYTPEGQDRQKELLSIYQKHRDESRENFKNAKEANPLSYGAGEIGGAVATSFVPGMGGANIAKLGAMGAAAGAGASEADLTKGEVGEFAKDTAVGAGVGVAAGLLAKGVGAARERAGKSLKDFAEMRSFKSFGPVKRHADKAMAKGKMQEIGRQGLDQKIVTPFASKEKMLDRISEKITSTAGELDDVLTKVQTGAGLSADDVAKLEGSKFVPAQAAEELKQLIKAKYPNVPAKVLDQRLSVVDDWLSSSQAMGIKDAQSFKKQMNSFINDKSYWNANPNASQEALMGIQGQIRKGIEKNADAYASIVGESGGQVKDINKRLGNLLEMEDIVDDRLSREAVNRTISPSDYGAAGLGELADKASSGLTGIATGLANNLGRKYGNTVLATGADKVSKALLKEPKYAELAKSNPKAFKALVTQISQKVQPERLPLVANENDEVVQAPLKGREKWANDGLEKLKSSGASLNFEAIKNNPKGKQLLIELSDLKPGTKAFQNTVLKIQKLNGGPKDG